MFPQPTYPTERAMNADLEQLANRLIEATARQRVQRQANREHRHWLRRTKPTGPMIANCMPPGTDVGRYLAEHLVRA